MYSLMGIYVFLYLLRNDLKKALKYVSAAFNMLQGEVLIWQAFYTRNKEKRPLEV